MTQELFFTEVSEAVSLPQDARQGIFDARGKMVLAFKDVGADKSTLFDSDDLGHALRDLKGSPYTVKLLTTSAIRYWGVFPTPFKGGGTFTFTGAWSPNAGPVAGCYTEWNPQLAKPFWGAAIFQLWSVQVAPGGDVRIIGTQPFGILNTAAGLVIPL
jgi:hypothetical protein